MKFLEVLKGLGVSRERQRVVLNRHTTLAGSVKPADVANRLGHDVDHVIPFDKGIVVAANTGEPYVLAGGLVRLRPVAARLVDEIDAMREAPPASTSRDPRKPTHCRPMRAASSAQVAGGGG